MNTAQPFHDIRRIVQLSNDGVFIYNFIERKFHYINDKIPALFNETGEAIRSLSDIVLKVLKAEDRHYLSSRFNELLKTGCITSTEFRLEFEDGTIRHLCCDAYVMDADNTIAGFVKDLTKTKEHEDFMINYGARKDTLLDMITHNLAGPLHMSKSMLDWTKQVVSDNKSFDVRQQLELIADSTLECINIVNEFLKEEHQESALTYVRKTRFDILERVRTTMDKLVVLNKDKHFRLVTDLDNLNITADSVKFFQVIHNLLSNSIKFTREGGNIDIKVEEGETDFTISVSDDGIGIPEQMHRMIFLQRSQAGRPGLKGEKSNGLGLFIAKQLVEVMGGTLGFSSKEEAGSTFFVKLPKE
ncbi:MAG: PAS domain-containing sensor histidine kinase [Chitinophagaceae bacterium]|nr:PAS domain-containing sensor histidine kinase [Chitinophagaceae bacterium]